MMTTCNRLRKAAEWATAARQEQRNWTATFLALLGVLAIEARAGVVITAQPQSQTVSENQFVALSVNATGTGALSYQWQKDGVDIPGATSSTFNLPSARPWHIGNYAVKITDSTGQVSSNEASIKMTGFDSGQASRDVTGQLVKGFGSDAVL